MALVPAEPGSLPSSAAQQQAKRPRLGDMSGNDQADPLTGAHALRPRPRIHLLVPFGATSTLPTLCIMSGCSFTVGRKELAGSGPVERRISSQHLRVESSANGDVTVRAMGINDMLVDRPDVGKAAIKHGLYK